MLKLSKVKEALESVNLESTAYFNKTSNEILWKWDFNPEYSTYKEEDEWSDDIICMFDFTDKNDYDMMQEFIGTIENQDIQEQLYVKTKGSGAFRRFRFILENYDLIDRWYQYRDTKYKEIAKEWCVEHSVKFEEDC